MKKILAVILAAVFVLGAVGLCAVAAGKRGDVDGDGEVNARDYIITKRIVLGTYTATAEQAEAADVNKDGEVNSKDYIMIKRVVLGTYTFKDDDPGTGTDDPTIQDPENAWCSVEVYDEYFLLKIDKQHFVDDFGMYYYNLPKGLQTVPDGGYGQGTIGFLFCDSSDWFEIVLDAETESGYHFWFMSDVDNGGRTEWQIKRSNNNKTGEWTTQLFTETISEIVFKVSNPPYWSRASEFEQSLDAAIENYSEFLGQEAELKIICHQTVNFCDEMGNSNFRLDEIGTTAHPIIGKDILIRDMR